MRTIVRYENGRAVWSDHGPGYGGSTKIGGELVTSGPRADSTTRAHDAKLRHRDRRRAGTASARRCGLDGRCQHPPCTALRAQEASRLYYTSHLTLQEIGERLGGRAHKTVRYLISLASQEEAA